MRSITAITSAAHYSEAILFDIDPQKACLRRICPVPSISDVASVLAGPVSSSPAFSTFSVMSWRLNWTELQRRIDQTAICSSNQRGQRPTAHSNSFVDDLIHLVTLSAIRYRGCPRRSLHMDRAHILILKHSGCTTGPPASRQRLPLLACRYQLILR